MKLKNLKIDHIFVKQKVSKEFTVICDHNNEAKFRDIMCRICSGVMEHLYEVVDPNGRWKKYKTFEGNREVEHRSCKCQWIKRQNICCARGAGHLFRKWLNDIPLPTDWPGSWKSVVIIPRQYLWKSGPPRTMSVLGKFMSRYHYKIINEIKSLDYCFKLNVAVLHSYGGTKLPIKKSNKLDDFDTHFTVTSNGNCKFNGRLSRVPHLHLFYYKLDSSTKGIQKLIDEIFDTQPYYAKRLQLGHTRTPNDPNRYFTRLVDYGHLPDQGRREIYNTLFAKRYLNLDTEHGSDTGFNNVDIDDSVKGINDDDGYLYEEHLNDAYAYNKRYRHIKYKLPSEHSDSDDDSDDSDKTSSSEYFKRDEHLKLDEKEKERIKIEEKEREINLFDAGSSSDSEAELSGDEKKQKQKHYLQQRREKEEEQDCLYDASADTVADCEDSSCQQYDYLGYRCGECEGCDSDDEGDILAAKDAFHYDVLVHTITDM